MAGSRSAPTASRARPRTRTSRSPEPTSATSSRRSTVRFGGLSISRVMLLGAPGATGLNVLDLVEPLVPRYAELVLSRALTGALRGHEVHLVSPEDLVILKVLSTRERDVEDASSVLRSLAGRLDLALMDAELEELARALPEHPIPERWTRARLGA